MELPPYSSLKKVENAELKITRIAEPRCWEDKNRVDVQYLTFVDDLSTGQISKIEETHEMRAFSLDEINKFITATGFDLLHSEEWLSRQSPSSNTWGGMLCFKKNLLQLRLSNFIPVNEPDLTGNEKKYLIECIDTGWISSEGPFVERLEDGMCELTGRKHAFAVCNGSAALELAVKAIGIQPGDEVILPTFTIISCALAVIRAGAVPVYVDADLETWNMQMDDIEPLINSKTKAIMAVHIYGITVDMDPLKIA